MAECEIPKLPKPNMKGLFKRQIAVQLAFGVGLSLLSAAAYKRYVADERKRKYAEYYRDYDPEEAFKRMVKNGADFQTNTE